MVRKFAFVILCSLMFFSNSVFAEESTNGRESIMFVLFAIVGIMLLIGVILLAYMWTKPEDDPPHNTEPTKNNNFNESLPNQSFNKTIKLNTIPSQQTTSSHAITFTSMSGEGSFVAKVKDSLSIGRGSSCDVVLSDNTISSNHARLTKQGDTFYLEDCNSSNGTLINGRLISAKSQLKNGDMIIFGKAEYQITF